MAQGLVSPGLERPWMRQWQAVRARWRGRMSTWRHPSWVCLAPPQGAACSALGVPVHDDALLPWRHWCEAHQGQHARLALSARWLLGTVLPVADGGLVVRQQAKAEAVSRWAHLLGLDESAWQQRWVTRSVALPQDLLVCAVPRALIDDVLAVAAHHRVALQWIGPWWAHGLRQWLSAQPPSDGKHRTLVMREAGWAVHAQAQGPRLVQLWAEPDAGDTPMGGV